MASLNLQDDLNRVQKTIDNPDKMLGKGAMMPFNFDNSGSRKLMYSVHKEQALPLLKPEVPLIQTGYEYQFGIYSSSITPSPMDYRVIGIVPKFSSHPNDHYYMLVYDDENKILDMFERKEYKHVAEVYGYLYDNYDADHLKVGDYIPKGTVIQKSTSFDHETNDHMDGVNLNVSYMAVEHTMEDGIVISESAARKLKSTLIKKVTIAINDNDILLNLYGDNSHYKTFPDIGEACKNDILCAVRQENKEQCLYSQSYSRLREIMISDDRYTTAGTVVDIDINANNPKLLEESLYNNQINYYYQEKLRTCREVISLVEPLLAEGASLGYNLQKLYYAAKDVMAGKQYIFNSKVFSNVIMDIYVIEENSFHTGDKLTNRYGGKGVVSQIIPDELMPKTPDGSVVDMIYNQCTSNNRLNPGQLFETSINFIGHKLVEYFQTDCLDVSECVDMYLKFITIIDPDFGNYIANILDTYDDDELVGFISSICNDDGIYITKNNKYDMTVDVLSQLYDEFPWIKPGCLIVPMKNSSGKIRYVKSRRPVIVAKEYIYCLKQYAEEKFSVTSLSATNIRNENSRSRANNNYKALYARTPIRFGEMEIGDMNHISAELVVQELMMYSTSPHGRRLAEQLMTKDPFNVNIKLDDTCKNRNAEILNVYLKTIGLCIRFYKFKKQKVVPFLIQPMTFFGLEDYTMKTPITFLNKYETITDEEIKEDLKRDKLTRVLLFDPIDWGCSAKDTTALVENFINKVNKEEVK